MKVMLRLVYLFGLLVTIGYSNETRSGCDSIERYLSSSETCACFGTRVGATEDYESTVDNETAPFHDVWIGCTRGIMPSINVTLGALKKQTRLSKLWIWDSLIPVIPKHFFGNIRPNKVVIESSNLATFRNGCFENLGPFLRTLELKNNIIKEIQGRIFNYLHKLHRLDLSGNKIEGLSEDSFGDLQSLHGLSLHKNLVTDVADGTFRHMKHLRRLNLGSNYIRKITETTFQGLESLEHLDMENNQILDIHPRAFSNLKRLKSLNLGGNLLTDLELSDLPNLERVYLNNNSFTTLSHLRLSSLPQLEILNLDKNRLRKIEGHALDSLENLRSLSLAANRIQQIFSNSFESLHELRTLTLQQNLLSAVPIGAFYPLRHLNHLFLSQNLLATVEERTLYGLRELKVLSLSMNQIATIHRRAFSYLTSLERLYLNDNRLRHLENTTFRFQYRPDDADKLYAIDLSDNPWACDCSLSWLAAWLKTHESQMANLDRTLCDLSDKPLGQSLRQVAPRCRQQDSSQGILEGIAKHTHGVWITVIGIILGVVSVLILLAIAVLYVQDSNRSSVSRGAGGSRSIISGRKSYDLRRVPSDMVTLIPKCTTVIEKRVRFDLCS